MTYNVLNQEFIDLLLKERFDPHNRDAIRAKIDEVATRQREAVDAQRDIAQLLAAALYTRDEVLFSFARGFLEAAAEDLKGRDAE